MGLNILFLDMNSFFASIEQQRRPELRGRPVAVAAVDVPSTCCIAASQEARRLGIKTGTPVWKARAVCPSIHIVEATPGKYVRFHQRIKEVVESHIPNPTVHSIDEMSCRLKGADREPDRAVALARHIKQDIYRNVGECMRCSIGLAPNRFLAKVASDMQKPDGLTIIRTEDLPHKLYPLELIDLAGIGPRMLDRLHHHGVRTVEQLYRLSEEQMRTIWGGIVGQRWWHWLRGQDWEEPVGPRRTISHSHVLAPEFRNDEGAYAVFIRLIHKLGISLRAKGYWARHVEIYLSFTFREEGWRAHVPLGLCQDTQTLIEAFAGVWPWRPKGNPTHAAVTVYDLVPDRYAPLPLFPAEQRRLEICRLMDRLNTEVCANAIYFGSMHRARDAAPIRIPFSHIPGEESKGIDASFDLALAEQERLPAAPVSSTATTTGKSV